MSIALYLVQRWSFESESKVNKGFEAVVELIVFTAGDRNFRDQKRERIF